MNIYRHITITLLLAVFAARIIGSVMASHGYLAKVEIEQQEREPDLQKDADKLFSKIKIEATDVLYIYTPVAFYSYPVTAFRKQIMEVLPQQYFAVPTPPPWCKS